MRGSRPPAFTWMNDAELLDLEELPEDDPLDRRELDYLPPPRPRPGEPVPSAMRPCEDDLEHLAGGGDGGSLAGIDLVRAGRSRRW